MTCTTKQSRSKLSPSGMLPRLVNSRKECRLRSVFCVDFMRGRSIPASLLFIFSGGALISARKNSRSMRISVIRKSELFPKKANSSE